MALTDACIYIIRLSFCKKVEQGIPLLGIVVIRVILTFHREKCHCIKRSQNKRPLSPHNSPLTAFPKVFFFHPANVNFVTNAF